MNTFEVWLKGFVQIIYENHRLCLTIEFMRKFGVFLLSVILFFSLLSLAFSVSSNLAFTHPNKVKSWFNQSNLYGAFISDAVSQAKQSDDGDSGAVSLNNPEIQKIAVSTFSSQALSGSVNTFVN